MYDRVEVNPHELKRHSQREKYLWYAAYETTLFRSELMRILKNSDDPALPMVRAPATCRSVPLSTSTNLKFSSQCTASKCSPISSTTL